MSDRRLIPSQVHLLARNILRERRTRWRFTLFEILMPIYPAILLLIFFALNIVPYEVVENNRVDSYPVTDIYTASEIGIYLWTTNPSSLAFSPSDGPGRNAAETVCKSLGISPDKVSWFNDSDAITASWTNNSVNITAGLSFVVSPGGNNQVIVHYTDLSTLSEYLGIANITKDPPGTPSETDEDAAVIFGYLLLQYLGVNALMEELSSSFHFYAPYPQVQKFPVAESLTVINYMKYMFSILFITSFFPSMQVTTTSIGNETEFGIRRTLQLKGMHRLSYWLAWWLGGSVIIIIAGLIQIAAIYACRIIKYTNFGFILALFLLFVCAIHSFCLLIVSLFGERASGRKLFAITTLLTILSQLAFFGVQLALIENSATKHYAVDLTFLFYVIPFAHVLYTMSDSELTKAGLSINDSPYIVDAYLMLLLDIFLYFILALLIDTLYERARNRLPKGATGVLSDNGTSMVQLKSGIRVRNLVKEFRVREGSFPRIKTKKLRAVDLSLDVEANQIFCLLGHNGAGKTTTLSLLTASLIPTSGDAFIDGLHVVRDRKELQSKLGVAPQFDICYQSVKCLDQLVLFGVMAGLTEEEALKQAKELLNDLMLTEKQNQVPSRLSGGQKRRLSLAIALMGNPKILLLDEVSTGLDVRVRKCVWTLLQKIKKHCTIILTTHSMEEADKLGDVIAIMSKGKLQAIGTSLELKRKYSPGYRLHCVRAMPSAVKETSVTEEEKPTLDVSKLEYVVQKYIKDAKLTTNIGFEVTFMLPVEDAADTLPELFSELEKSKEDLGITSFGLSPSTLEDVFLTLDEKEREKNIKVPIEQPNGSPGKQSNADETTHLMKVETTEHFECDPKPRRQMYAIYAQMFIEATRSPLALVLLIFWPAASVCISGAISLVTRPQPPVLVPVGLNGTDTPYFEPYYGVSPPDIVSTLLSPNTAELQSGTSADWISNLKPWDPSSVGGYTGAIDFQQLNYSAQSIDFTIIYNQSTDGSVRSILATLQEGISKFALNEEIQVGYLELRSELSQNSFVSGGLTFYVSMSFTILAAFYAEEMVRDRVTRMKDVILLSGMPRWLYWYSHFNMHMMMLIFTGILVFVIMIGFGMEGPTRNNCFGYIVHLLAFGCSNILFGYLLSQLFSALDQVRRGLGQLLNLSVTIPWLIVTFALSEPNETLESVLNIFPGFGFYRGMAILENSAQNNDPFSAADVFVWDRLLIQVILLNLLAALFWLILLICSEQGYFRESFWKRRWGDEKIKFGKDESSEEIFEKLFSGDDKRLPRPIRAIPSDVNESELPLLVKDARKTFISPEGQPFHACKNISLGVKRGEILGLLGPNGAGKTTLLSCINGVDGIEMDGGDAFVMEKSVVYDLDGARKHMGICFQFDALNEFLTGREHMRMICRLRGVPPYLIEPLCEKMAESLDLKLKVDARAGTYSGGNKRKLSVALSLLAHPDVCFLDEPSTGLDPATRRFLWNFLEASKKDKAIVLTTHSMEEADNLSSEIAIMVSGAIRTYGTSQQLKSAFGTDLSVTVRVIPGPNIVKDLLYLLKTLAPGSHIDGNDDEDTLQFLTVIKFNVPCNEATLSALFSSLNRMKEKPDSQLVDFSVSQTSLEDVFIRFAMMQEAEAPALTNT